MLPVVPALDVELKAILKSLVNRQHVHVQRNVITDAIEGRPFHSVRGAGGRSSKSLQDLR